MSELYNHSITLPEFSFLLKDESQGEQNLSHSQKEGRKFMEVKKRSAQGSREKTFLLAAVEVTAKVSSRVFGNQERK